MNINSIRIVATHELRLLVVSPIAWVVVIVFYVQFSIAYLAQMQRALSRQFAGLLEISVSASVFQEALRGVFSQFIDYVLLYVPLMTMGIIAREMHSGSIKLVLSSPVRLSEFVLGKYLALVVYFSSFVFYLLALALLTGAFTPNFDYLTVLAGIVGMFLMISAYAAVGLFMSSLTPHQVVAAVATLAVLAFLSFVGSIGQRIPGFAEIAYWLSSSSRARFFGQGLIASKDVIYFVGIVTLFVGLTYLRLAGSRLARLQFKHAATVAAFCAVVVAVGLMSSSPRLSLFWDTTMNKRRSLSPDVQALMERFQGDWSITAYANVLDRRASLFLPSRRRSTERYLFDNFERENANLAVDYVLYYGPSDNQRLYDSHPGADEAELAQRFAYQNRLRFESFLSADELRSAVDLSDMDYKNFYVVSWNGKSVPVSTFDDARYFPDEEEIATAIKMLVQGGVKLAYASGAGERSVSVGGSDTHSARMVDRRARSALVNNGFLVDSLDLSMPVPEDIDILVIADPSRSYTLVESENLENYIRRGGNALILAEPSRSSNLSSTLDKLQIHVAPGELRQNHPDLTSDIVFATVDVAAARGLGFDASRIAPVDWEAGEGRPLSRAQSVAMPGAGAMKVTGENGFTVARLLMPDSVAATLDDRSIDPQSASGILLSREIAGRTQRIAIVADADFLSDAAFESRVLADLQNRYVFDQLFKWLADDEFPIDVSLTQARDFPINMQLHQLDYFKVIMYGGIPLALGIWGGVFLTRRRRR